MRADGRSCRGSGVRGGGEGGLLKFWHGCAGGVWGRGQGLGKYTIPVLKQIAAFISYFSFSGAGFGFKSGGVILNILSVFLT